MDQIKIYRFLKFFFVVIAVVMALSVLTQYITAFVHYDNLLMNRSVLDGLNRFFQNLSMFLLALVLNRIFHLLITRDIESIKKCYRILNSTIISFGLLGIIRVAIGLTNLFQSQVHQPNPGLILPLTVIHIMIVQASPIVIALTVYVLYRVIVDLVQFETEVA